MATLGHECGPTHVFCEAKRQSPSTLSNGIAFFGARGAKTAILTQRARRFFSQTFTTLTRNRLFRRFRGHLGIPPGPQGPAGAKQSAHKACIITSQTAFSKCCESKRGDNIAPAQKNRLVRRIATTKTEENVRVFPRKVQR